MKKVLVLGCGGSGKSTLARQLAQQTQLPIIHLDQYFWKPGWVEVSREEWIAINKQLLEKESWIMDGNYGSTMDMRIEKADTIIFLDMPTYLCLWRVLKRRVQYHRRSRPSISPNCPEQINLQFLHYILLYRHTRRPGILKKLDKLPPEKTVHILSSPKAVKQFLNNLTK